MLSHIPHLEQYPYNMLVYLFGRIDGRYLERHPFCVGQLKITPPPFCNSITIRSALLISNVIIVQVLAREAQILFQRSFLSRFFC